MYQNFTFIFNFHAKFQLNWTTLESRYGSPYGVPPDKNFRNFTSYSFIRPHWLHYMYQISAFYYYFEILEQPHHPYGPHRPIIGPIWLIYEPDSQFYPLCIWRKFQVDGSMRSKVIAVTD